MPLKSSTASKNCRLADAERNFLSNQRPNRVGYGLQRALAHSIPYEDAIRHGGQAMLIDLEKLHASGLHVYVSVPGVGCKDLTPRQVAEFLQDPEGCYCQAFGISRQQYRAWQNLTTERRCTGITGSGQRCSKWVHVPEDPRDFEFNVSDRCLQHRVDRGAADSTGARSALHAHPGE